MLAWICAVNSKPLANKSTFLFLSYVHLCDFFIGQSVLSLPAFSSSIVHYTHKLIVSLTADDYTCDYRGLNDMG